MDFQYKKAVGLTIDQTLSLEWLETNGLGGYASSTVINCNTRKYHGLLVSNLQNPFGKYVFLSQLEDVFCHKETEHFLTAHQYRDAFLDGSFDRFQEFNLTTHPCFIYRFGNTILHKEILLLHEKDTLLIKYKLHRSKHDDPKSKITIRPLLACRDFHALTQQNSGLQTTTNKCQNGCTITPYQGLPSLFLQTSTALIFQEETCWYNNFHYIKEQERGFACEEDLFAPGIFTLNFDKKGEVIFSCSLQEETENLQKLWNIELKRRHKLNKQDKGIPLQQQLQKVGRSFFQKQPDTGQISVVAGYHWFGSWGRDTMISLPGLTLLGNKRKAKKCLAILQNYSQHEQRGLIPNFLGPTKEQNAYNTIDASLWFAWTVQQYYLKTKSLRTVRNHLWPTLKNIFHNYKNGTDYGIHMTDDGLIASYVYTINEENKLNLTWMDAVVAGQAVTPRHGTTVEVNALWYNMLCFMRDLAEKLHDPIAAEIQPLIELVKNAFCKTFWDENLGFLRDFVDLKNPENPDSAAMRPNQIFAVSLPHSPLSSEIMTKVVDSVREHLLTPYGLRTLSPKNSRYQGIYQGSSENRDLAYHNGSIWPWLLGHFTVALIKTTKNRNAVENILNPCLAALEKHLFHAGIGTISEIFAGDEPHHPDGCVSQAWSVAEILRMIYLLKS